MISFGAKLNLWLGKHMFLVVLTGLCLGLVLHVSDNNGLRRLIILLFAYMTFVTALGTSFRKFAGKLMHPWLTLWILLLVHIATPLTAWLVGIVFYPDNYDIRIGYLIGATIPIGVTSLIWTALVKGDTALSLAAITLDTLLAPLILPLFFQLLLGQIVSVGYFDMVSHLILMITLPSIAGMLVHDVTNGRIAALSHSIGGATAKLALMLVICINAALIAPEITWTLSLVKLLLVTFFVVAAGYFVGYLGSYAVKERSRETVLTLMYNVGIRNIASGLVLALTYFSPAVALPMILAILYQQPLATLIPYIYQYFSGSCRTPKP